MGRLCNYRGVQVIASSYEQQKHVMTVFLQSIFIMLFCYHILEWFLIALTNFLLSYSSALSFSLVEFPLIFASFVVC